MLVIDDFGLVAVTSKQYRDLLEILDDRHGQGATLITSQFPVSQWHELINDATMADAILTVWFIMPIVSNSKASPYVKTEAKPTASNRSLASPQAR